MGGKEVSYIQPAKTGQHLFSQISVAKCPNVQRGIDASRALKTNVFFIATVTGIGSILRSANSPLDFPGLKPVLFTFRTK